MVIKWNPPVLHVIHLDLKTTVVVGVEFDAPPDTANHLTDTDKLNSTGKYTN